MISAQTGTDLPWGLLIPAYAAAYAACYQLGLLLYFEPQQVAVLWPASGFALGVLLLLPRRMWPGLLALQGLLHLLLAWWQDGPLFAIGVTTADLVETAGAALLVQRLCTGSPRLDDPGHIARLVLAGTLAAAAGSIIGALTVWQVFGGESIFDTARLWLLSDLVGILIITPAMLALREAGAEMIPGRRFELLTAGLLLLLVAGGLAFGLQASSQLLQTPVIWIPLLWIGLRGGPALTAMATAVAVLMLVGGADLGRGVFIEADQTPTELSLRVQVFVTVVGIGALLIAASACGRQRALASTALMAERLRTTLSSIGDGVIATDAEGRVELLNPVAGALTGWTEGAARGRSIEQVFRILSADTGETVVCPARKALSDGNIVGLANNTLLQARDGSRRHIADAAAPIRDADGTITGTVLVFRDVSERRQLEERLRQTEKLEVIGQLSSGIAHDLNNMLGGVLGGAELLQTGIADGDPGHRPLQLIFTAIDRMRTLNMRMLAFAGRQRTMQQTIVIDEAIAEAAELAGHGLSAGYQLVPDLQAEGACLSTDRDRLQSCLINLVINARDAMPQGGRIALTSRWTNAGEVSITVRDNGCGIEPELLERVFEPFFTTKDEGRGTGLGLHAVRQFAQSCEGRVAIDSEPGRGTSVILHLPAGTDTADGPAATSPAGHHRLLLVDDDELLRTVTTTRLQKAGIEVIEAADGLEGLEALAAAWPVDLVVLDVVMPRLNGLDLLRLLRAEHPGLPVVVVSGRLPEGEHAALLEQPHTRFLGKPFSGPMLDQMIAELLQGRTDTSRLGDS